MTSKTKWESRDKDKPTPRTKKSVHPKRYTDPIDDVDKYIEIELQSEEELDDADLG